eukprot:COSAG03_NODE_6262_length_1088_cov_1.224469_2_plen_26_part_01
MMVSSVQGRAQGGGGAGQATHIPDLA